MHELLLELLSEEIPARMQARAADDLKRLVTEKLAAAGLVFERARAFATPRRLALVVEGLPLHTADTREEKKGPRIGAPEQAIQGFLKSTGLGSLDQCEKRTIGKAEFWFAVTEKKGVETDAVLPGLLVQAIGELPWPKSMRFADANFRWVRPLQSILAVFDGKPLPGALPRGGSLDPLAFDDGTTGHRFLAPQPFKARNFEEYRLKLKEAHVVLDREERRTFIERELHRLAAAHGLAVKEDRGLLEEVTGLVEWPVVLIGQIDPRFTGLPPEVLSTSMRTHQKYFTLMAKGRVTHFAVVANMVARDGGKAIVAGNERVLRARLSDAEFFWEQDKRATLEQRLPGLKEVVFHAKLGSVHDKAERMATLAAEIARHVPGCDAGQARRAARLSKADLVSGMVGEFPELQGVMGRYYALNEKLPAPVAEAIADHYAPQGPNDRCPTVPVSVAVALADKIDTLVGFFAIDEKPTGSKDPFALRRAALGVIRLVVENGLRFRLRDAIDGALIAYRHVNNLEPAARAALLDALLEFFADRLKVALKEKGVRHDLIAAVFALGGQDDIVDLLERVRWLDQFVREENGQNLLIAYRRAANILRIEEKKDGRPYSDDPDYSVLKQEEELTLFDRLNDVTREISKAVADENYFEAMVILAGLRGPVDAFFDKVTVNADATVLRANRLMLLNRIRRTMDQVADFGRIEG